MKLTININVYAVFLFIIAFVIIAPLQCATIMSAPDPTIAFIVGALFSSSVSAIVAAALFETWRAAFFTFIIAVLVYTATFITGGTISQWWVTVYDIVSPVVQ